MVTALLFAGTLQGAAAQPPMSEAGGDRVAFDCRVLIGERTPHSVSLEIHLAEPLAPIADEGRAVLVTIPEGDDAVLPGVQLPVTEEAVSRSLTGRVPGYVQFGVSAPDATYLVALHDSEPGRDLPAALFISRSDQRNWRRNWYWANGFCVRRTRSDQ